MGLYRGWLMVGVVTALSVLSFPAFGLAVAQWVQLGFVLPPPVGFGWTQTQAGTLFGSATAVAGLTTWGAGVVVDRVGARVSLLLTGAALSFACALGSTATSATPLWVTFFVFGVCGSGFLQLIPKKLLSYWFLRRRGRALSIIEIGMFFGFGVMPFGNVWLIESFGWRAAWQAWAVALAAFTPVAFCLVRNSPHALPDFEKLEPAASEEESEGLMSGEGGGGDSSGGKGARSEEVSLTLGQAVRGRTLWTMLLLVLCRNIIMQGMEFQIAICAQAGFGPVGAAGVLSSMTAFAALVNFPSGVAAERRRLLVPLQINGILGTAAFLLMSVLMIETRSYAVALLIGPVFGLAESQCVSPRIRSVAA